MAVTTTAMTAVKPMMMAEMITQVNYSQNLPPILSPSGRVITPSTTLPKWSGPNASRKILMKKIFQGSSKV
jgi:hypothetical protein